MFIRSYLDLSLPFDDAEEGLMAEPEVWLPGVAREAQDMGEHLLGQVGFSLDDDRRVSKDVHIDLGPSFRMPGKTLLPLSWKATGPERLFPSLDADLEIAALGRSRTQLSISGRYRPPLGVVGKALDRVLLHRVAEATIKDFLDRVGEGIEARVSGASV
jgi:hypothetical protein